MCVDALNLIKAALMGAHLLFNNSVMKSIIYYWYIFIGQMLALVMFALNRYKLGRNMPHGRMYRKSIQIVNVFGYF